MQVQLLSLPLRNSINRAYQRQVFTTGKTNKWQIQLEVE
jgi:hypothetical protein